MSLSQKDKSQATTHVSCISAFLYWIKCSVLISATFNWVIKTFFHQTFSTRHYNALLYATSFSFSLMSLFGEGNGNPLQSSCLENPMDGGAWWAAVHGVARSQTRLSDFTFPFHFHALEKEMATHSRALAWRIPGTGEPGGLPSVGLHRVGHHWSYLAAAAVTTLSSSSYFGSLFKILKLGI